VATRSDDEAIYNTWQEGWAEQTVISIILSTNCELY
jgi:hypothetical protein